jgi:hypothetical protein
VYVKIRGKDSVTCVWQSGPPAAPAAPAPVVYAAEKTDAMTYTLTPTTGAATITMTIVYGVDPIGGGPSGPAAPAATEYAGLSTAEIAGIAAGSVGLFLILVVVFIVSMARRRRR